MRFIVIIRRTGTGYSVDVPDLPGCVSTGMTVEHARQQIAQAIEGHLEVMRDSGETLPTPTPRQEFQVDEDEGEVFVTWVEVELAEPVTSGSQSSTVTKPRSKRKKP